VIAGKYHVRGAHAASWRDVRLRTPAGSSETAGVSSKYAHCFLGERSNPA
jgi:hypothetical protein